MPVLGDNQEKPTRPRRMMHQPSSCCQKQSSLVSSGGHSATQGQAQAHALGVSATLGTQWPTAQVICVPLSQTTGEASSMVPT